MMRKCQTEGVIIETIYDDLESALPAYRADDLLAVVIPSDDLDGFYFTVATNEDATVVARSDVIFESLVEAVDYLNVWLFDIECVDFPDSF